MVNNQRMSDVMQKNILVISSEKMIAEVRKQVKQGQIIIVLSKDDLPLGVIPEDVMKQLSDPQLRLSDYQELYPLATLTTSDTSISVGLQGMVFDQSIRWHVVIDNQQILGVIPPEVLFRALLHMQHVDEDSDEVEDQADFGFLGERLYGNELSTPTNLCYRCKENPSHRFVPEMIERRDKWHRALCPKDGSVMIAENPCRGGA